MPTKKTKVARLCEQCKQPFTVNRTSKVTASFCPTCAKTRSKQFRIRPNTKNKTPQPPNNIEEKRQQILVRRPELSLTYTD